MTEHKNIGRMNLRMLGIALALYTAGAVFFLHLFSAQWSMTIFGDEGDGLFNLWILEHTSRYIAQGFNAWSNGQIFWPQHAHSFWWSDNLLTFAPLYALLKQVSGQIPEAYWWTVQLLSFGMYLSLLWFYQSLYIWWTRGRNTASPAYWLGVPVFAGLMFFSQIHLHNYLHFQHLAAGWLILMLTGCLRFMFTRQYRHSLLIAAALLCLVYSAPYYAVLGCCLLPVWALVLFSATPARPWQELRRHTWLILLAGLLAAPAFIAYKQAEPLTYAPSVVRELSMQAAHWYTPLAGWLKDTIPSRTSSPIRPGGYPGIGLLLGLGIAVLTVGWIRRTDIKRLLSHKEWWCWLVLWLITLVNAKEVKWLTCYLRVILVLWVMVRVVMLCRRHIPGRRTLILLYLGSCGLVIYGTAFGPGELFRFETIDPSVWGFFSSLVPGYSQMREVIRFAPLGQMILGGMALLAFSTAVFSAHTSRQKVLIWSLAGVLILLQFSEIPACNAHTTGISPAAITLREDETIFYDTITGSMAVLPTTPFHRNTYHMLRWMPHQGLILLNGYSARSTAIFDRCMELERTHGRGSPEQIAYLQSLGVDYLTVFNADIPEERLRQLNHALDSIFYNQRLTVFRLP